MARTKPDSPTIPPHAGPEERPAGPLSEQAYQRIKQRLITLGYQPGEFLSESAVCAELGIGRTPVHQAFHRLKLEGLVEIIPRKGVMVRADSLNDVISLIEARMIVEPPCMALAAERAQAHHLERLEELLAQSAAAIGARDRERYMALDSGFHGELVGAAANSVLVDIMRILHQRASRIWRLQVWNDSDLKLTQVEHEAIFKAVRQGDREAANAAAQAHLASLRRRILRGVG